MALTGLEIFKLLPKSNCKKCGKPTCLAFAMALAQKKAKLEECPDASDDAKTALAEASAPPISLVKFGTLFRQRFMDIDVSIPLEEALDLAWQTLAECFEPHQLLMKQELVDKYLTKVDRGDGDADAQ